MSASRIALTMGDPAGVGPEIAVRSLFDPAAAGLGVDLCAGRGAVAAAAAVVGLRLGFAEAPLPAELAGAAARCYRLEGCAADAWLFEPARALAADYPAAADECFAFLEGGGAPAWGRVRAAYGLAGYLSIALADRLCKAGHCRSMATAPIHKEALRASGVAYIGHTEILGGLCGVADPLTMFETLGLRIFFHSRHVSLRDACGLVTRARVLDSLRRCHAAMAGLGLASRRLAVAALNPHGGEHGLFGDEDQRELEPAVADARAEGIDAHGPIGADSVFHLAKTGRFDAVLSLYHDQGHIAAKTLDFDRTVSLTLGLPYLRSSVDHGTAMDIAGRGLARATSMTEALTVAARYG